MKEQPDTHATTIIAINLFMSLSLFDLSKNGKMYLTHIIFFSHTTEPTDGQKLEMSDNRLWPTSIYHYFAESETGSKPYSV